MYFETYTYIIFVKQHNFKVEYVSLHLPKMFRFIFYVTLESEYRYTSYFLCKKLMIGIFVVSWGALPLEEWCWHILAHVMTKSGIMHWLSNAKIRMQRGNYEVSHMGFLSCSRKCFFLFWTTLSRCCKIMQYIWLIHTPVSVMGVNINLMKTNYDLVLS